MPLLKFPTEPLPDLPERVTSAFTTIETRFGDGYRSEAPSGINARTDTRSLSWTNIYLSELQIVLAFLEAHAPATPFLYEQVGTGIQLVYTCKEFDYTQGNGGLFTINAKLVQFHGGA